MFRSIILSVLVVCSGVVAQSTWYVDGAAAPGGNGGAGAPFQTIMAGIAASSTGDTVLVAAGTYGELINFQGKNITVRAPGGWTATTINGGGLGTVVTFQSGNTAAAVLDGFTVTGGVGSNSFLTGLSGGVHCAPGSAATIRACRIAGNMGAHGAMGSVFPLTFQGGKGGAGGIEGAATVLACLVENNTGGNGGAGGNSIFPHPPVPASPGGAGGVGGVDGATRLESCVVTGNAGGSGGSGGTAICFGCGAAGGSGGAGGARAQSLVNTLVINNVGGFAGQSFAPSPPVGGGAGGVIITPFGSLLGCAIASNSGGASAGASADQGAGGAEVRGGATVLNTTIWGNVAVAGGVGGLRTFGTLAMPVTNVILWNNGVELSGGVPVQSSIIQGGYPGLLIQSSDPKLVSPAAADFHLQATSPAINFGDPTVLALLPAVDGDQEPRVGDGALDIGADEYQLRLQIMQPAGPGSPVTVTHSRLAAGAEYFNLFSSSPCSGGLGSGPILGLCFSNFSEMLSQLLLPVGTPPFHYLASAPTQLHGPFAVPPVVLESVLFRWDGTRVVASSAVVSVVVQ